jgi:hypothetical protein
LNGAIIEAALKQRQIRICSELPRNSFIVENHLVLAMY